MKAQVRSLATEMVKSFPLRLKIRRGKTGLALAINPTEVNVSEKTDRLAVIGEGWTLTMGEVHQVQFAETISDGEQGRRASFLDANGKAVFRLDLRRPNPKRIASFDRLRDKYAATIAEAPAEGASLLSSSIGGGGSLTNEAADSNQ